jgi:hypothetical protein
VTSQKKTADGTEQKETWDDEQEGSPTFFSSSLVKREETAMFGSTHVVVLEVSVLQGRYLFHKHAYKKVQTLQERETKQFMKRQTRSSLGVNRGTGSPASNSGWAGKSA